ncbi:MAG: hypothetical protein WAN65_01635 [Candidatus Sulfotelmatobacter sp.]
MRTSCRFLALLSLGVPMLLAQNSGDSCCQMTINSGTGLAGVLNISIKNVSQPLVTAFETLAAVDFTMLVRAKNGSEAKRTEYGRHLLERDQSFRRILRQLKLGESFSQQIDLNPIFELKPGVYNIVISRNVTVSGAIVVLRATVDITMP